MKVSISLSAAFAAIVTAKPMLVDSSSYAVKETHPVPPQFTWEGAAPKGHPLKMSIGLRQGRFHELEKHLAEVSDPDHHRYGQHLSGSEVHSFMEPSEEALSLVHAWLAEHEIGQADIEYSPAKDYLTFVIHVDRAERLLDTTYSVYRHEDGTRLVRTPEWALPQHLHEHIDTVQPTNAFIRAMPQAKLVTLTDFDIEQTESADYESLVGKPVSQVCDKGRVTPLCLRTLYETVNYQPRAGSKNQVALNDFLGELNLRSDAKIYLQHFRPEAVKAAQEFKQVSVAGGTLQQTPLTKAQVKAGTGIEGNLDAQTILGISYPVQLTTYSTKGKPPPFIPDDLETTSDNEPYLTWINYILKQDFIPQVISNSYEDDEQTVPKSYAQAVCRGFAQLGARGVSVIFGSGDGGVSGVQNNPYCKSNVNNETIFVPNFPSSCPYVTSVGATVNFNPEVVAYDPRNGFASGGGFSNYFDQPAYQQAAVASYLKKFGNKYSQYYNRSGRAYPDLATYGVNYTIAWDGQLINVDGTSAATPTAAGIFTLLNDALISHGKAPLGFLNPWLYKKGYEAFVDVTSGNTRGCNTTGFVATEGWDAASGFGTPRFSKLLAAVGLPSGGPPPYHTSPGGGYPTPTPYGGGH